jgi:hypothetical protein
VFDGSAEVLESTPGLGRRQEGAKLNEISVQVVCAYWVPFKLPRRLLLGGRRITRSLDRRGRTTAYLRHCPHTATCTLQCMGWSFTPHQDGEWTIGDGPWSPPRGITPLDPKLNKKPLQLVRPFWPTSTGYRPTFLVGRGGKCVL